MKKFIVFALSAFCSTGVLASYSSHVGTIEWFIEKNNTIYQQQKIANPNSPKYNRTLGTMTKPIGTTKLPTYMPQRITQQSFARGMFNALVKRHPVALAATTAIAALEIYECATSESGWCTGGQEEYVPECPNGGDYQHHPDLGHICTGTPDVKPTYEVQAFSQSFGLTLSPPSHCTSDEIMPVLQGGHGDQDVSWQSSQITGSGNTFQCQVNYSIRPDSRFSWTPRVVTVTYNKVPSSKTCPPTDATSLTNNFGNGDDHICWAPAVTENPDPPRDVTLDDLKRWIAERPNVFDDVPDTILKDPVTGKPDDTFFDNPRHTPISPPLSDAFESLGTGLAQDSNPSAPYYIPPELKPDVETARDKFHDGEPFTDPFTNTTVTPDPEPTEPNPYTPPAEITVNLENLTVEVDVDMNWDEFPGITQDQYEESNDKMAEAYDSFETPDVEGADSDFLDTLQEPTELPFAPYDFGNLWPISGGQCTGFNVNVSVRGEPKTIVVDKHCPPYNEWAHPLLSWFLQLLAALHIFHLFSRMISAG